MHTYTRQKSDFGILGGAMAPLPPLNPPMWIMKWLVSCTCKLWMWPLHWGNESVHAVDLLPAQLLSSQRADRLTQW